MIVYQLVEAMAVGVAFLVDGVFISQIQVCLLNPHHPVLKLSVPLFCCFLRTSGCNAIQTCL